MSIKIFLICLICIIIGFTAGYLIPKNCGETNSESKISYNKGWEDAKKRIEGSGVLSPTGNDNFYKDIVNGEIKKIDNNILYVEIVPFEILSTPEMSIREIKVTNDTKILKTEKKSESSYSSEVKEYYIKHPEAVDAPFFLEDYPSIFYEINVGISDLKVEQKVTVKATEDIVDKKMFTAQGITILNTD